VAEKSHPFPGWWVGYGWSVGVGIWALVAIFGRRRRRDSISVPPMSDTWLIEQEISSGRESGT
jgi:hypothetical protein